MSVRLTRRKALRTMAAVAAGVAAPAVITRYGWAQTGTIKLGMVEPLSGPNKYYGEARIDAVRLVVERINAGGGILGRQVEFLPVDSEMKPDVSAKRSRELLRDAKVDFITGFSAPVNMAVAREANAARKIFVSSTTLPTDMTAGGFYPTTFACSPNAEMYGNGQLHVVKNMPFRKIYVLGQDVGSGRVMGEYFARRFPAIKRADQELVGVEYHPTFRVSDFGPYITKVIASGADCLVTPNYGPDQQLLIKQGFELGWKLKVVGPYLNDPVILKELGAAGVGNIVAAINIVTLATPQNQEWVKLFRARYPDTKHLYSVVPDAATGMAINAYSWMFDIAKRTGSLDTEAMIKTWEGAKFQALWGEVEMRACDHQIQTGIAMAEIKPVDQIPQAIRFFDFPYIGAGTAIPRDAITVPAKESANKRCLA